MFDSLTMVALGLALKNGILEWTVWKEGSIVFLKQTIKNEVSNLDKLIKESIADMTKDAMTNAIKVSIETNPKSIIARLEFENSDDAQRFYDDFRQKIEGIKHFLISMADRFEREFANRMIRYFFIGKPPIDEKKEKEEQ